MQETRASTARSLALDALRGLSILAMMLSGAVPWEGLPGWMYHGQEPPPTHAYDPNQSGITWVDLVFPFFLFAMGAAIPLSQSRRLTKGSSPWRLAMGAAGRCVMLIAFAFFDQHARPYSISATPTTTIWLLGVIGFVICLAMFVRYPEAWPASVRIGLRIAAWGAAVFFVAKMPYRDGVGFSKDRSDIIILVLAWMALFGTVVWLVSRQRVWIRFLVMGALVAIRMAAELPDSPLKPVWEYAGVRWLFSPEFLGYLLIVLPGTLAGEVLLHGFPDGARRWSFLRSATVAVLCFAAIPILVVLFYDRWSPLWSLPLVVLVALVAAHPGDATESRVVLLCRWGVLWLAAGIALESFQGGIKKDPATISYWFSTSGLAMLGVAGLMLVERAMPRFGPLRFVAVTGQNPMVAYLGITNLVDPLWALALAGLAADALPGPNLGVVAAGLKTLLLGGLVVLFTRLKIVMRT